MNRNFIKRFLPKRLLPRLLLIFLIPLIIIQCSVIFFFYDRHWEKIIIRFSNIASNKINLIINQYKENGIEETKSIAAELNIFLSTLNQKPLISDNNSILEKKIKKTIHSRVNKNIDISFDKKFITFYVEIEKTLLKLDFPRKYLLSETPTIYILWIISTSLLLSLIAFLFLRIQIRAIHRLAKSAEDFGKGKKINYFKPEGAMEIRSAGNAFLKMRKRINNYIDQKTSFLTGISHDLGTIITRIKLRLELLKKTNEINDIKKDVEIMQIFLKEYLDYSDNTKVKKFTKINIFDIIEKVIEASKIKNVSFKCNRNVIVLTDANSLHRIVFNLIENASKFGKKIEISVKKKTDNIIIDIEDDGPGISNEFKKKIFKPFYKIDDSRNLNEGGSGLGLSIAKELAKNIKAKIKINDSKKLRGSLFSISIPRKV